MAPTHNRCVNYNGYRFLSYNDLLDAFPHSGAPTGRPMESGTHREQNSHHIYCKEGLVQLWSP